MFIEEIDASTNSPTGQALVGTSVKTEVSFQLLSPTGGQELSFTMVKGEANKDVLDELMMHLASIFKLGLGLKEEFEKMQDGEWKDLPWSDAEKCVFMVARLNECIAGVVNLWGDSIRQRTECEWFRSETCNAVQCNRLSVAIFNRVVKNAQALNTCYKSFSSLTYGETSFDQVQIVLDRLKLTDKDVFVDLGSGVGQVVTYTAAYSQAKRCVGIEINKLPALLAESMKEEFKSTMSFYGKKFRPFELFEDDFLDQKHRNLITKEATVIFINNFAFEPSLMFNLREIIMELEDGVRIVCNKSFLEEREDKGADKDGEGGDAPVGEAPRKARPPSNRTIARQTIDQMLDCEELPLADLPVSWATGKGVQYFLFTVNRSKIEKMFEAVRAEALATPEVNDADASTDDDDDYQLSDEDSDDDYDYEYAANARKANKKHSVRAKENVPKKRSAAQKSTSRTQKKSGAKKEKPNTSALAPQAPLPAPAAPSSSAPPAILVAPAVPVVPALFVPADPLGQAAPPQLLPVPAVSVAQDEVDASIDAAAMPILFPVFNNYDDADANLLPDEDESDVTDENMNMPKIPQSVATKRKGQADECAPKKKTAKKAASTAGTPRLTMAPKSTDRNKNAIVASNVAPKVKREKTAAALLPAPTIAPRASTSSKKTGDASENENDEKIAAPTLPPSAEPSSRTEIDNGRTKSKKLLYHEALSTATIGQFVRLDCETREQHEENLLVLARHGMLYNSMKCRVCQQAASLVEQPGEMDGYVWSCQHCKQGKASVRFGSFFKKFAEKSLGVVLQAAASFVTDPLISLSTILAEPSAQKLAHAENYIVDVVQLAVTAAESSEMLGGLGAKVDMERATLYRNKYRGSMANRKTSNCIVLIDRESRKFALVKVLQFTKAAFAKAAVEHTLEGSRLISSEFPLGGADGVRTTFNKNHKLIMRHFVDFDNQTESAEAQRWNAIKGAYRNAKNDDRADWTMLYVLSRTAEKPVNSFLDCITKYNAEVDSL